MITFVTLYGVAALLLGLYAFGFAIRTIILDRKKRRK